ncbi:MAG: VOC family protein [Acidobacteria bacterium]|nr:VOC family protein [Acidobacteriota bacterium]MBI3423039.1 VOC family protein [Acidobacteriota bacterium]
MNVEPRSTSNVKQAVPFFHVHDIEASVRFYVAGLGFTKTKEWMPAGKLRWCMLQHGDAAIMLQEFWQGDDTHPANVPTDKLGVGVSICFFCADALALYRAFKARGVAATRPFVGNGMWVTSVSDPDGYRLEFESYTDAPEESEYAEAT